MCADGGGVLNGGVSEWELSPGRCSGDLVR